MLNQIIDQLNNAFIELDQKVLEKTISWAYEVQRLHLRTLVKVKKAK